MRILIAFVMTLSLAACVVPVQTRVWDEADRAPRVGDLVRVETLSGRREVMRIYRLDPDGFAGVTSDEHKYVVKYDTMKKLEVRVTETEWVDMSWPVRPYF